MLRHYKGMLFAYELQRHLNNTMPPPLATPPHVPAHAPNTSHRLFLYFFTLKHLASSRPLA
jgi:hypothetical protein